MSYRITVVTGGSTPEREVALAGAAQVVRALRESGHTVNVVDTTSGPIAVAGESSLLKPAVGREPPDAETLAALRGREAAIDLPRLAEVRQAEVVFLVLHGEQGEGGDVQALLDDAGILYTGSGPTASALAMDKKASKAALRNAGVPTPDWLMWPATREGAEGLGFPLIVKPSRGGSTVGLSLVRDWAAVAGAVHDAARVDPEVMLERFVGGAELTVGVLGDEALAVGQIIPQHEIFDYECKYTPGMTQELFPAPIDAQLATEVRERARTVHRVLGLRDFSRVDFRLDEAGQPWCLEANTLPGVTATSLLPQSARASGIGFQELCERIVELALRRTGRGNKVKVSGNVET